MSSFADEPFDFDSTFDQDESLLVSPAVDSGGVGIIHRGSNGDDGDDDDRIDSSIIGRPLFRTDEGNDNASADASSAAAEADESFATVATERTRAEPFNYASAMEELESLASTPQIDRRRNRRGRGGSSSSLLFAAAEESRAHYSPAGRRRSASSSFSPEEDDSTTVWREGQSSSPPSPPVSPAGPTSKNAARETG